jgi:hypothetical protein
VESHEWQEHTESQLGQDLWIHLLGLYSINVYSAFKRTPEALPQRCIPLRPKIDVNTPRHPASYFVLEIMKKREEMGLDSPHLQTAIGPDHSYQGN